MRLLRDRRSNNKETLNHPDHDLTKRKKQQQETKKEKEKKPRSKFHNRHFACGSCGGNHSTDVVVDHGTVQANQRRRELPIEARMMMIGGGGRFGGGSKDM